MRTRSTYPKRRRPPDQPPTDGDHPSEAFPPPHRRDVSSAMEVLHQDEGVTAPKPVASQLEPVARNVSSDGGFRSHPREAPVPSPAVSPPVSAEPPQNLAAKRLPAASGGSCGGGSARKKSRLSLNRRRGPVPLSLPPPPPPPYSSSSSSSVVGTGGSNLGLRGEHESAAHGSPWRPPPQQRCQSLFRSSAATAIPPPGGGRLATRKDDAGTLAGGPLGSTPPCSLPPPPPPPPFVGLENLGETCYVNAVAQALVACYEAAMPDGMAAAAARVGPEDSTGLRGRADGSGTPFSLPCVGGEGVSVEASASAAVVAPGEGGSSGGIGGDENPVLAALGNLLKEMKTHNRALPALASGDDDLPQLAAPPALAAPSLSEDAATHSETGTPADAQGGSETAAISETRRLREPPPLTPGLLRTVGLSAKAISPIALVDLIHEGWLSAGRGSGRVQAGRERYRGRLADRKASADFGSGQQCASELLGKLLDLPAATAGVPSGGEAAPCSSSSRGRDMHDGPSGLIEAFRGALCARTTCVECERDRATREEFTELTLPPLPPQRPPPSPNRAAEMVSAAAVEATAAADNHSQSERLTLEGLVDAVLGSETLDGRSKVWCEACRQWTEAKRRFSIHSPPRLLALHIRPATGGQPICPPPPAVGGGGAAGMRGSGPRKAGGQTAGGSEKREGLIERVLIVKGAARSGFHETVGTGAAVSWRDRTTTTAYTFGGTQEEARGQEDCALEKLGESEDVRYELVGIILHKGQTLGSGHYTFARHTGASARPVEQRSRQRPQHWSSALGVGGGEERYGPLPREAGARSSKSASAAATEGVHGSAGEGGAGNGLDFSTNKKAFAFFDDACVRWLSPEEECNVFRGGGPGGGLGEAFLVFYARRP